MEASSGLDESLRDALASEQEVCGQAILEVGHELAAQAAAQEQTDWTEPSGTNIAEHISRIEHGVMLASLAEVAQTRMR